MVELKLASHFSDNYKCASVETRHFTNNQLPSPTNNLEFKRHYLIGVQVKRIFKSDIKALINCDDREPSVQLQNTCSVCNNVLGNYTRNTYAPYFIQKSYVTKLFRQITPPLDYFILLQIEIKIPLQILFGLNSN